MEEMLGMVANARVVFERWMRWEPDHNGWNAYVRFETRYKEWDLVRKVYERYCACHPSVKAFVRWAKFEFGLGEVANAREVYESAVEQMALETDVDQLYVAFAKFEELAGEVARARGVYAFALDNLPKEKARRVFQTFASFEKQHGDRQGIEDVVLGKRRVTYEEDVRSNPENYDAWFDYARMEESAGDLEKTREVYERAVAVVPPATEKRYWRRYIYLWINYALFEELEAKDNERAREVYRECLKLVPHASFSFSKIWILAAKFEIRRLKLAAARKILGVAIGLAPKAKIFETYVDMEMQLGNVDRCRTLYQKHLEIAPHNCFTWEKFAELENSLGETERARAIFEIAIARPVLDMPEVLWKAYVDFEIGEGERARARDLYERLLDRTQHVKVWMSYAQFEAAPMSAAARGDDDDEDDEEEDEEAAARRAAAAEAAVADDPDEAEDVRASKARAVYERALLSLKEMQPDAKEERVMLLEAWKAFEESVGSSEEVLAKVEKKLPRRVKRKRPIYTEDGTPAGQEEYYDYIFPEEQGAVPNLKILEAAHRWKKQKLEQEGGEGE
jgi:crooked neck